MLISIAQRLRATIKNRLDTRSWAGDAKTRAFLRQMPECGLHRLSAKLNDKQISFWVRGGTLDVMIAREILCEASEYRSPKQIDPKVILDVGANIGMTSLYYLTLYPNAHIYCFEPVPENLELLRRNLQDYADRVTIVPKGLGEAEGTFTFERSTDPRNFGGGGFHGGGEGDCSQQLPVTTLTKIVEAHGIERVDLIKLDAEGAEGPTLRGAPAELIANAEVLIGELHGRNDLQLLQQLDQTHQLGITKRVDRKGMKFVALRSAA